MRIILIEDDHLQEEPILNQLRAGLAKHGEVRIRKYQTASDFEAVLEDIAGWNPDVFVIDIMLPLNSPDELSDMSQEEIGELEETSDGGFVCLQMILEEERLASTAVFLFSVLEEGELKDELQGLPANVRFMRKESDLRGLIAEIESALQLS